MRFFFNSSGLAKDGQRIFLWKWSQVQIFLVCNCTQTIIWWFKYPNSWAKEKSYSKLGVFPCFFLLFFILFSLLFSKSIGCDYTNHGYCNNNWNVMHMCHWISIYTTIAIYFATHTIRIPGKDAAIVFGVYNCRFGRIYITHRISSICILWCSVSFYIFTIGLPVFCTDHWLCGWWIEFHYKDTWINGIWCAYTAVVLLHAMLTTDSNYQVS